MPAIVEKDRVVTLHYTLKDEAGTVVDQSGNEPLEYLHGHKNIIPGLEKELTNAAVGAKLNVHVQPEDAYGNYDPEKRFFMHRKDLPPDDIQPGMALELTPKEGEAFIARVVAVTSEDVEIDANHPMAGKQLFFEVEVASVREATADEIAHGHVHGADGHHH